MPTYKQEDKLKTQASTEAPKTNYTGDGTTYANGYDPVSDQNYQAALAALNQAGSNAPTYTPSYNNNLQEIYNKIVNRDKFSYDVNADALYQQMKDQYIQQGKMAMMDTMGQAAAMTGGYGSSYGQSVGQQAYNSYLQELNNNLPEYYDRAYQQYANEGEALLNQYSLTGDLADREKSDYETAYNQWYNERNYAADQENAAYNRGLTAWQNQYNVDQDLYNRAYQESQDAYSRQQTNLNYISSLISSTGYNPTDEELAAAGMTRAQANALISAYENSQKGSSGNYIEDTSYTKSDYVSAINEAYEAGDEALADEIRRMYLSDKNANNGTSLGAKNLKEYNYWKNLAG